MAENVIETKTYAFALEIVKLSRDLMRRSNEFIIARQLLRSGTSIGANTAEAIAAYSKKDFAMKLGIAFKEANETRFWLRLIQDSGFVTQEENEKYLRDIDEIIRILGSILKTMKTQIGKKT